MPKQKTSRKFTALKNVDDFVQFLRTRKEEHKYYYHYTTISTLKAILESNSFRFTHGTHSGLNDQHEIYKKACITEHNKNYIFCLTHDCDESIAMWNLYTQLRDDAIRIQIPCDTISQWIKSQPGVYPKVCLGNSLKIPANDYDLFISDIAYCRVTEDGEQLEWLWDNAQTKEQFSFNFDQDKLLAGLIKNTAWKFEQETRIIIQFKKSQDCQRDYIYAQLSQELIESLKIFKSPWFNDYKHGQDLADLLRESNILTPPSQSRLKGKISLKQ